MVEPLTKEVVLAACQLAYQNFLARTGLSPEKMSDSEKMIAQIFFVEGCDWTMARVTQVLHEADPVTDRC